MAGELGASHSDVRLSCRHPARGLYDERHRVFEHELAQSHQNAGFVPERRRSVQITLLSLAQHREKVDDANQELESGDAGILNHLRRARADAGRKLVYTFHLTPAKTRKVI